MLLLWASVLYKLCCRETVSHVVLRPPIHIHVCSITDWLASCVLIRKNSEVVNSAKLVPELKEVSRYLCWLIFRQVMFCKTGPRHLPHSSPKNGLVNNHLGFSPAQKPTHVRTLTHTNPHTLPVLRCSNTSAQPCSLQISFHPSSHFPQPQRMFSGRLCF